MLSLYLGSLKRLSTQIPLTLDLCTLLHNMRFNPCYRTPLDGSSQSNEKRKRDADDQTLPKTKRSRPLHKSSLTDFDPADLVKAKEGTFDTPDTMKKYLEKHLRRCLSKEERDALFKEHPKPNLAVCAPPKVDKFISDFLGKRLPKDQDQDLTKIQAAILACARPLTNAWHEMVHEMDLEDDHNLQLPATQVLTLIQCTLCLVGNASELVSQTRRAKILEVADKSWAKFAETENPPGEGLLFGEEFRSEISKKVEADNSLSKALSITKRSQKTTESASTRRDERPGRRFFRQSPATQYGSGRGRNTFPYNTHTYKKVGEHSGTSTTAYRRFNSDTRFHEPRFPPSFQKTQQKKQ